MPVYKGTKTNDGRSFYFRKKYKDIFGVQKDYTSKKYLTKKEAEEEEARFIIKTKETFSSSSITIKESYIEYRNSKEKNFKPQTLIKEDYMFRHLAPLHNVKINNFDLGTYKKFKIYFDSLNLSAPYKNKTLGVLRRIIKYANKYYGVNSSILNYIENYRNVEQKKEMDFFTLDEYKLFSSVIDRLDYKTMFDILFYLGLRVGELQALTWNDIDLDKATIKVGIGG